MITIDLPSSLSISISSLPLSKSGLSRFLNNARAMAGVSGDVEVLLTTDSELKRLNKSFRGKNKATDVLSFPAAAQIAQVHAGDLAISLDTAARQAEEFGHSLRDEVRILLLHGLLHLTGFDHETDMGQMATREAELRKQLKLPVTLIERVSGAKSGPKARPKRGKR